MKYLNKAQTEAMTGRYRSWGRRRLRNEPNIVRRVELLDNGHGKNESIETGT